MRVNSINFYNSNQLSFGSENKNKADRSMLRATKAIMLATALSAAAGSCDKLSVEHNHYFDVPVDTFTKTELVPTPVPPQVIIIEKEVPGETDTIIQEVPVPQPPDTIFKTDTFVIEKPVPQPPDTIFKTDTFVIEKPPIIKWDTAYITLPPEIKWDTIYLKGDTVWMKEDWTSPVPPKQEEIYDELGIIPGGNGKFFIAMSYYDNKNSTFVQRHLDGQASSRDGNILVYNVVKTKWDNEAEGVVLGKNETFEKQLVYLSEDRSSLGMKIMAPKVDIKVSNNDKKTNWNVFEKGTLSTPDAWKDADAFFAVPKGGIVELSNSFKLKKGLTDQSVTTINPYGSEWELKDWHVAKGDAD